MKKRLIVGSLLLLASAISYGNTFIEVIVVPKGWKLTVDTTTHIVNRDWRPNNIIRDVVGGSLIGAGFYTRDLDPGMYFADDFKISWQANGHYAFTAHNETTGSSGPTYYLQERNEHFYIMQDSKDARPLYLPGEQVPAPQAGQFSVMVDCDGNLRFARYQGK